MTVPDYLLDPETSCLLENPVMLSNGEVFEENYLIHNWDDKKKCPRTGEKLVKEGWYAKNLQLAAACEEFLQQNPWALDYNGFEGHKDEVEM